MTSEKMHGRLTVTMLLMVAKITFAGGLPHSRIQASDELPFHTACSGVPGEMRVPNVNFHTSFDELPLQGGSASRDQTAQRHHCLYGDDCQVLS